MLPPSPFSSPYPFDRASLAFYSLTRVPAPMPHQAALEALSLFLEGVAMRLAPAPRRARSARPAGRRR
jgi:hypothetical protein